MKKLLTLLLIAFSITTFAQNINSDSLKNEAKKDSIKKANPLNESLVSLQSGGNPPTYSTGADAIGRYGDYPIDLVNGLVPIEIPIYTVQSGNITVPVKLSYHSAGIKVNDVSTPVGLGWSLMAGGAITRSMQGKADEISLGDPNYLWPQKSEDSDEFYCLLGKMIGTPNNVTDFQPDIFYYNFPGGYGRFQLARYKSDSTVLDNAAFVTIPYKPLKITYQFDDGKIIEFTLTDTDGTKYVFGKTNDFLTNNFTETQQNPTSSPYISAWYLRQIISAETSDLVEFEYTSPQINKYGIHGTNLVHLKTQQQVITSNSYTFNRPSAINYSKSIYLNKIKFNNGQIEMNYLADRQDIENSDNSKGLRLTNIDIKKRTGITNYSLLKRFVLGQTYFNCNDGYSLFDPTITNSHVANHVLRKRLKLSSVTEQDASANSLPPYQIAYNETEALPITGSTSQDFWGFYNGQDNRHSLLTWNASSTQLTGYTGNNIYSGLDVQTIYGANRYPNESKIGLGLIESIIYPDSGKTKFLFEANKVAGIVGGGMRILATEQYAKANDTDFALKNLYNYDQAYNPNRADLGIYNTDGSFYTAFSSQTIIQSETQQYCYEYTSKTYSEHADNLLGGGGTNIAYSKVTIKQVDKNGNSIGKTVKTFEEETDQSPIFSIKSRNRQLAEFNNSFYNKFYALPLNNRSWKRGNLLKEEIFKGNTLIKEIVNDYNIAKCDSLVSTFYGATLYQPNTIVSTGGCPAVRSAGQLTGTCPNGQDAGVSSGNHYYNYTRQNAEVGYKRLNSTTITNYDENGANPIAQTITNDYYNNTKLQGLKSVTSTNSDGTVRKTEYTYPQNLVSNATYLGMVNQNKLDFPVTTKVFRDNVELYQSTTNYNLFSTRYLPSTVTETYSGGTAQTLATNTYHTSGYLASTKYKSGQTVSYAYFSIINFGKTNLLKTKTIAGGPDADKLSRSENYDYEPLVGIKTFSDINNYNTNYGYDNFLRLSTVIDHNNNFIGKKFYHFAGQAIPSGLGASPATSSNFTATARAITEQSTLSTNVDFTSLDINYSDGLGRPIQSVVWKGSPDKSKDILTESIVYDDFGRATKSIIPTPSNLATGAYNATHETLAETFYGDTKPFNLLTLENSPLSRPKEMLGAGQNWHTGNKAEKINYQSAGSAVAKYVVSGSDGGASFSQNYAANTLFLNVHKDEIDNETAEYIDKEGNTLLASKKVNSDTTLYTTYIYDGLNRLRYTLMPEAYGTASFTESDAVFTNHIYAYHYDNKGRMYEKHIPGAGWTRLVFDINDNVVLSQNAKEAGNRYSFTKYDALGRPVQSGVLNTSADRATIQTAFDNHSGDTFETRSDGQTLSYTDNSYPSSYKPSEANFRLINFYDDYSFTGAAGFISGQSPHGQGNSLGFSTGSKAKNLVEATATWYTSTNYYDYLGRQIQEHIGNHAGTDRADMTYRYDGAVLNTRFTHAGITSQNTITYDHQARPLTTTHTIAGNSKALSSFAYDNLGRTNLKTVAPGAATFGSEPAVTSVATGLWPNGATWNTGQEPCGGNTITISMGNVVSVPDNYVAKTSILEVNGTLHFGNLANLELYPINNTSPINLTALQKIQYRYNTRSWLTGINPTVEPTEADLFSYSIAYLDNGNIATNSWASPTNKCVNTLQNRSYEYTYDAGNRLRFAKYTGQGDYSIANVQYTKNGNIQKLQRKGRLANGDPGLIDNLTYTYFGGGNKLESITDGVAGNNQVDFVAGTGNFVHNADGSLATDPNENTSITYDDFLSQPNTITAGSATMNFTYTGDGSLLKATDKNGDRWEYFGPMTYKNDVLFEIATPEGRAINHNGVYLYEFDHTDHLGNKRVSFTGLNNQLAVTSVQDFDPFGVIHAGNSYANGLIDRNGYQGKTKEQGLNRIDLGFRTINPTTGIFDRSDPLAEMTPDFSPFSYGLNNTVNIIDEWGLTGSGWNTRGRQETEAETANKEAMGQADNRSFIEGGYRDVMTQSGSGKVSGANTGNENEHWSNKGEKKWFNIPEIGQKVLNEDKSVLDYASTFFFGKTYTGSFGINYNVGYDGRIKGMVPMGGLELPIGPNGPVKILKYVKDPKKIIVLGENMTEKVIPYAKKIGGKYFKPRSLNLRMDNQIRWIDKQLKDINTMIITIGKDIKRSEPSKYYLKELERINKWLNK
jgi:RHS repeat-associated protein